MERTDPARAGRVRLPGATLLAMLAVSVGSLVGAVPVAAWQDPDPQTPPAGEGADALRVYLDCASFRCDRTLFRQEIQFVNWVREPQDAQVYVLMTDERTGAGGFRYTFDFEGRQGLEEVDDQLVHASSVTDVEDEVKESLRRILAAGLAGYAARAGLAGRVDVRTAGAVGGGARPLQAGAQDQAPVEDPWNFWVFNIDGNVRISEEDRRSEEEFGFTMNANRTTPAWKTNVRASGDFERQDFQLGDTVIENDQDSWDVSAFAVKTMGDHWGVGAEIEADNSTRLNRDLLAALGSGIEYNYFPYSESNRRVLLARYVISAEHVNYQDTTIFDLLEETVYKHEAAIDFEERGPWGNANVGVDASQFLDRTDFYSVGVRGSLRYRIFRGFSVNLDADYDIVRDQIFLSRDELSDEDILLGRVTLPTDSEWSFRVGLGYNFGSIFNNAVNTRFRRGVR